ncbi:YibE/F family protein [Tissierella sp. MSJ-40]|uniref:YibE/F family protein n=1 Tax=Tissierella simiarum TaxID=2841534 RepID=A0ABS6E3R0_9FIRM|nr:YibE/F family protein [Tissierella simiarum]MBU5437080.1 YibE/F family protein [Tissierella simiarum]
MKKNIFIFILSLFLTFSVVYGESDDTIEEFDSFTENAVVLEASKIEEKSNDAFEEQIQYVKLKITSGKYKNKIIDVENILSNNFAYDIVVKKGDKVVVIIEDYGNENIKAFIADYSRQNYLLYLSLVFIALIIIIGKGKGVKAVISLIFTVLAVLKVLLPLMLKGVNPVPISILISIGVTVVTIFLIGGINNKSFAAIIGTTAGVVMAGLISYYVGSKVQLTGLSSEEATMLMYIPQNISFDFKNLLFSGIILGALGAVMDVGMSIASSIEEIHNANNSLTRKELFSAGMNVGRDVMGTMTNTLILAYTGSSIPLLLLFMAYETSIVKILNLDVIATEIIRSLAGSIGLVLTIPLTALVASFLIKRDKNKDENIDKQ